MKPPTPSVTLYPRTQRGPASAPRDASAPPNAGRAAGTDGLALVAALREAMRVQASETTEKLSASHASALATAAVRAPLVRQHRLARRAHPRGTAGHAALALGGPLPTYETDLFVAGRLFYETADAPEFAGTVRSLTPEAIAAGLARLDTAEQAEDDQVRETGESQRATALRQQAEAALRTEAAKLAEAATDALTDMPQLREVLGLIER